MRFDFRRGDRIHSVELTDLGGGRFRARWWARPEGGGEKLATDELELHVCPTADGAYSVLCGADVHDVRVDRKGPRRTVTFRDGEVALEHVDPFRALIGSRAREASGPQLVSSPIPGRVVSVPVAVGDEVTEGQTVIVVEAMKMANEMRAPAAGRIAQVRAVVGDAVEAGATLIAIAPNPPP